MVESNDEGVPTRSGPPWNPWETLKLGAIFVAVWFFYAPTLWSGQFNVDDRAYLKGAQALGGDFSEVASLFVPGHWLVPNVADYSPVLGVSLWLTQRLFGPSPFFQHLVSILIYTALCGLLFIFLRRETPKLAFFAALLFALHPLHTEPVVWLAARADVLATFFFLLAFFRYRADIEKSRSGWIPAMLLLLGLMAKPTVTLFLLFFSYELFISRSSQDWKIIKAASLRVLPAAGVSTAIVLVTIFLGEGAKDLHENPSLTMSLATHLIYAATLIGRYLSASVLPVNQLIYYPPYPPLSQIWLQAAGTTLVLALSAAMIYRHRASKCMLFLVSLFLLPLLPHLQLIPFHIMQSDRYAFIALLSVVIGVCWATQRLQESMQNKALSVGVLTVVVGLFSYATALRVSVWKSASSVWAESVRSTEAPFAIMRYANALFHEGHFAASANEYVRVINLVPTSFKAWRFGINSFLMAGDVVNGRKFLDASEAHVSAEKFRQLEIAFNQAAQRKGLPIRVQIPAPDSGELPSPHSGELQDTSRF